MVRTSAIDAQIWVCKLRHKNIVQFKYKDLPKDLKNRAIFFRAKEEGFIVSIKRIGNGRNLWKISDRVKCRMDGQINGARSY